MNTIYFLIPIGLVMLGLAIWAFIWAVNNHQYEDMENPSRQILFDDKEERQSLEENDLKNHQQDGAGKK